MKLVINKCYGGFGLSPAAEDALIGKCEHVTLADPQEYYGGPGSKYYETNKDQLTPDKWRKEYEEDLRRASKSSWAYTRFHNGKVICDEHHSDAARSCPALIKVVEEMGEAANGHCAKLAVIEIPDDVQFEISEYDGNEWVAEKHRTWS